MNKSTETKIVKLMRELVNRNGSDLHLSADKIPFFRIQGQILPADSSPISLWRTIQFLFSKINSIGSSIVNI